MARPRVYVVDNSPVIRETIPIVLGEGYRVRSLTVDEYLGDPLRSEAELLIVGEDSFSSEGRRLLADGPPVLWLQNESRPIPSGPTRQRALAHPFSPEDLLADVQALLLESKRSEPSFRTLSIVDYPVIPQEAASLARRAAATDFPVLICGEPGTGKARLARAIHALRTHTRFVTVSAGSVSRTLLGETGAIAAGDLTIFVNEVGGLTLDAQLLLLELLDCGGYSSQQGWHRVRLVCAVSETLENLARIRGFDKELLYRLSVLPITLPALRQRPQDIPALADHVAAELARLLSATPVAFTRRAVERMVHYLWFGNLAEMETVLTRTVVLTHSRSIDAEDLLFGYGRMVPRSQEGTPAPGREVVSRSTPPETVDLIINELAHEFKNPMVTIKTVSQHLERWLADEAGREQVARLTGEAVDRMDRALENLLQFTRFRSPSPHDVSLNTLLAPCLTDITPVLTERRVLLNYRPPEPAPVFVDAAQIGYAFENLLRVITRDLAEGETLAVRPFGSAPGVVFEFGSGGRPLATKLVGLLDHAPSDGETPLPLGLVLAQALIERNGGRLEMHTTAETASITVCLPSREEIASGNGKTTSLSH